MGIRETQIYGLKREANKFLEENVKRVPEFKCLKCGCEVGKKMSMKVWRNIEGMFGEPYSLYEYELNDGRIVRESPNKYMPLSSGMCIFYDLVDEDGNILFGWSEDEINKAI